MKSTCNTVILDRLPTNASSSCTNHRCYGGVYSSLSARLDSDTSMSDITRSIQHRCFVLFRRATSVIESFHRPIISISFSHDRHRYDCRISRDNYCRCFSPMSRVICDVPRTSIGYPSPGVLEGRGSSSEVFYLDKWYWRLCSWTSIHGSSAAVRSRSTECCHRLAKFIKSPHSKR